MSFFSIFGEETKTLTLGGMGNQLEFHTVIALQESSRLENNGTVAKSQGARAVVWLYNDDRSVDYHNWDPNVKREEKLRQFDELYQSKKIVPVLHTDLNAIGFNFAKLIERQVEIQEDLIVLSFLMEQHLSLEDKQRKQEPPKLADSGDPSVTETALLTKSNQGAAENAETNSLLARLDQYAKTLWE